MNFRGPLACLALVSLASASLGQDPSVYDEALGAFVLEVERNQVTSSAYWFEKFGIFDQWDKVILIFGYAGSGNQATCEQILRYAMAENPGEYFRCNPAN